MKRALVPGLVLAGGAVLLFTFRGFRPEARQTENAQTRVEIEEPAQQRAHKPGVQTVASNGPRNVTRGSNARVAAGVKRFEPGQIVRGDPVVPVPAPASDRSPLADQLGVGDEAEDVRTVAGLFEEYRRRFGAMPAFEDNADAVRALSGANPGRLAILPTDHPAIGPDGVMRDRWGTPYFFHAVSRDRVEVRSAGADRAFYSADDALFMPRGDEE